MSDDFKFQTVSMLKLCTAIIEHGNDSEQADTIRDAMDNGSWHRLTDEQRTHIRKLSAHIHKLEEELEVGFGE